MLGAAPDNAASVFLNRLFDSEWTAAEIRGSEGYARDHFHVLLERETPPVLIDGSRGRAAEILTWFSWRIFQLEQRLNDLLPSDAIGGEHI